MSSEIKTNSNTYIHTHIIGHYNPSIRFTTYIASHTPYAIRVNIIHEWPKTDCLENFCMAILFAPRIYAKNVLR